MRRLALLTVAVALVVSACFTDEGQALLDAWMASADTTQLKADPNPPDVKAAGDQKEAEARDEETKEDIKDALGPGIPVADRLRVAEDAVEERPRDAKHRIYLAIFQIAASEDDAGNKTLSEAKGLIELDYAHIQDEAIRKREIERQFLQDQMSVALTMIHAQPEGSFARRTFVAGYCAYRTVFINENYGDNVLGFTYWDWSINHSLCP